PGAARLLPGDARLANRGGHLRSGDQDAPRLLELDRIGGCQPTEPGAVAQIKRALHRQPGHRAVHRAGVEIAKAQPLGETPRNRALACPCGAVDGDDHRLETESRRSKNPGKLIATASASPISTPSREVTPAIAASIAMRWSPSDAIRPPVGRAGTPLTSKPSSCACMRT